MRALTLWIILICTIPLFSREQELIVDTCFSGCQVPKSGTPSFNSVSVNWINPTEATPDLFFINNPNYNYSMPKNFIGYQMPYEGIAYAGIYIKTTDIKHFGHNWREYISIKLASKLISNQCYCLILQISLADTCNYFCNKLQALFTSKKINYKFTTNIPYNPQVSDIIGSKIINKKDWTKICSVYKAEGGEQYLTLGNFDNDTLTSLFPLNVTKWKKNPISECTYYYIGFVSLKPIHSESECDCSVKQIADTVETNPIKITDTNASQPTIFTLKDINFEIDKSELLEKAYPYLDSIYNVLSISTSLIGINGYTDAAGTIEHNLLLSKARAQAVANYFENRGISANRIIINGYGSTNPIADNATEEGKRENRRVEIILLH